MMSADDYYLVRKAATPGKFVALHGFASSGEELEVNPAREELEFDSPIDALLWAQKQGAEYGASLHDECADWKLSKSKDDDA